MEKKPSMIKGGSHTDHRGTIHFVNDFDMSQVKRFYLIEHPNMEIIRAWRAHRIEQRWFSVLVGKFVIRIVKIDNWESPTKVVSIQDVHLSSCNEVLYIPSGYGTWIQAEENNSKLLVFGDYGIEHAFNDDYLYPQDYFTELIS